MDFFRVSDLPPVEMMPGVTRRAVWLDGVMVTFFEFAPQAVIPTHEHPHEQISYVVRGGMEFTLGEETRLLRAGEGVCIPPGMPHGARVLDQSTMVVDAWHPPRDDYK